MFDLGAIEILLIIIVAVIVIGPKDMPMALRQAGRWIGKMRKLSGHFRSGLDAMVREAELEDMEKKWAAKNAKIMEEHPSAPAPATAESAAGTADAQVTRGKPADDEATQKSAKQEDGPGGDAQFSPGGTGQNATAFNLPPEKDPSDTAAKN